MIKCQICGKECKTVQGLAGHMQNKHGILGAHPDAERLPPSPKLVSEQQLSELAERVDELEGSVSMVETELEAERGVERLVGAAEQSKELTERDAALLKQLVERVNKTAELARNNAEQLKNIAQPGKRSIIAGLARELGTKTVGDLLREQDGEPMATPMQKLECQLNAAMRKDK